MNDPVRVLCVDDSPEIHVLIQLGLKGSCFQVVGVARTGEEALLKLVSLDVDLVLLDIFMPITTGIEVLPLIRNKYEDMAIVMLTTEKKPSVILECDEKGADGYIVKSSGSVLHLSQRLETLYESFLIRREMKRLDDEIKGIV